MHTSSVLGAIKFARVHFVLSETSVPSVPSVAKCAKCAAPQEDCSTAYQSQIDLCARGAVPYSRHAGCTQMASHHLICGVRGPCEEKLGSSMSRTHQYRKKDKWDKECFTKKKKWLITKQPCNQSSFQSAKLEVKRMAGKELYIHVSHVDV